MAYTWQYLGYLASELRRLTQLSADLETDLKNKNVDVPQPDAPPPPAGGGQCYPPWNCTMPLRQFRQEVVHMREYQETVLRHLDKLIALAQQTQGDDANFPHRLVEAPVFPGPPIDLRSTG